MIIYCNQSVINMFSEMTFSFHNYLNLINSFQALGKWLKLQMDPWRDFQMYSSGVRSVQCSSMPPGVASPQLLPRSLTEQLKYCIRRYVFNVCTVNSLTDSEWIIL